MTKTNGKQKWWPSGSTLACSVKDPGSNPGLDASQKFILRVGRADRISDTLLNVTFRIAISDATFIYFIYYTTY